MWNTVFHQIIDLITGALLLKPEAYQQVGSIALGGRMAFLIVVAAGLSQAIAQGIVLFVNRVKPFRFVLSLFIAALLFAFGFVFWVLSTWIAARLLFGREASLASIWQVLGLSYAPQLLSFFIALPYLGVPIGILLSIWSFLAFLTGLMVALQVGIWPAFWCGALGWAVLEILQRTIGRPVEAIGQWIANTAAGVHLVTDLKQIEQLANRLQHRIREE